MAPDINFHSIRPHRLGRDGAFEELTRQLVLADPPVGFATIENRGPGADGGVEILVKFSNSSCWGWQSKFFLESFGNSEVQQLKKSFESALESTPLLQKYFVAIPRNLSGSAGSGRKTQRKYWNEFRDWAERRASQADHPNLKVELWDESYFVSKLQNADPIYAGMRSYWFDQTTLTQSWFERLFDKSKRMLGERFSPEDHVEIQLSESFDILRRGSFFESAVTKLRCTLHSSAKRAIALARETHPVTEELLKIGTYLRTFSDRLSDIDWSGRAINFEELLSDLNRITTSTEYSKALKFTYSKVIDEQESADKTEEKYAIRKLLRDVERLSSILTQEQVSILKTPRIFLVGEAGAGKSHLLADQVHEHIKGGYPAFLVLGQSIVTPQSPEEGILRWCDSSTTTFGAFLGSLQSAALATGRPAIIAIDAINESVNANHWRDSLLALVAQIKNFDRLALIVSCRSTYRRYCAPDPISDFVTVEHRGFDEDAAKAVKVYLDRHGIDRPSAPFLSPEFTNPLFLSTCVRALAEKGETSFPKGLEGLTTILSYWLDGIERSLHRKSYSRIKLGDGALKKAVCRFADELAISQSDRLPYGVAEGILEEVVGPTVLLKVQDTLLWQLTDEGVLRVDPTSSLSDRDVYFTFQRFSDHFVADAIIRLNDNSVALARALRASGDFHYVFGSKSWRHAGIRQALMSQVPERFGIELFELDPSFSKDVSLQLKDFIESICWRNESAITQGAVNLLRRMRDSEKISDALWYNLLLRLSNSNSPLNADFLIEELERLQVSERDVSWSRFLVGQLDEAGPVTTLIDWAWNTATQKADVEKLRLVALALALFTSAPDRSVRDYSTKALSSLFLLAPSVISRTLCRLSKFNDLYVRERVLAAAASAIMFVKSSDEDMAAAALAAYTMVFDSPIVEYHAYIRRYANLVVQTAQKRGCLPDSIDISKTKPPYNSRPIVEWPDIAELRPLEEQSYSIISSVLGYISDKEDSHPSMAGDFGRYVMGGIAHSFSNERRSKSHPSTQQGIKQAFWAEVSQLGPHVVQISEKLKVADHALQEHQHKSFFARVLADRSTNILSSDKDERGAQMLAHFSEVERDFLVMIPPSLADRYKAGMFARQGDDEVPKFDLRKAQRWVAKRSFDVGWTAEVGEVEKSIHPDWDGREHQIERFGKKYQWIAYHELIGYLADHHWYFSWSEDAIVLDNIENFENFDIDPGYLAGDVSAARTLGENVPKLIQTNFVADKDYECNLRWTQTLSDIPDVAQTVVTSREKGGEWWMVYAHTRDAGYLEKMKSGKPFRTGQCFCELMLMQKGEPRKLLEKLKNTPDVNFFKNESPGPYLYGQLSYQNAETSDQSWFDWSILGFNIAHVSMPYAPKKGEYDASCIDLDSFSVPRPILFEKLKLEPESPRSNCFVNPSGEVVFFDGRVRGDHGSSVIRGDVLGPLLEELDLVPVWRIFAEKDGGLAGDEIGQVDRQKYRRQGFVGLWWREKGCWIGDIIHQKTN